jgi:hypothetical protein
MGEARDVWERVGGVSQVGNGVQIVPFALGRELGGSIYRESSKLAVGQIFLPETGWTAPGTPGSLSASLTGRLQVRLQKQVLTPVEPLWTPVELALDPGWTCLDPSWSWNSAAAEEAQLNWSSAQLKSSAAAEEAQLSWSSAQLQLKKLNSAEVQLSCSWRSSATFQQEHSRFLKPNHGLP